MQQTAEPELQVTPTAFASQRVALFCRRRPQLLVAAGGSGMLPASLYCTPEGAVGNCPSNSANRFCVTSGTHVWALLAGIVDSMSQGCFAHAATCSRISCMPEATCARNLDCFRHAVLRWKPRSRRSGVNGECGRELQYPGFEATVVQRIWVQSLQATNSILLTPIWTKNPGGESGYRT